MKIHERMSKKIKSKSSNHTTYTHLHMLDGFISTSTIDLSILLNQPETVSEEKKVIQLNWFRHYNLAKKNLNNLLVNNHTRRI